MKKNTDKFFVNQNKNPINNQWWAINFGYLKKKLQFSGEGQDLYQGYRSEKVFFNSIFLTWFYTTSFGIER